MFSFSGPRRTVHSLVSADTTTASVVVSVYLVVDDENQTRRRVN